MDTLSRCVTRAEVRSALDNLPEGLDETYERILHAIDTKGREGQLAQRALTWLVAALRPLQLDELVEGLSINLRTRTLDSDFGPMHYGALLDACGSLVTYTEKTGIIILSHFSVKVSHNSYPVCCIVVERPALQEYLIGQLIFTKLPQYHITWEHAHLHLARSCLCYLSIYLDSFSGSSRSSNIAATDLDGISTFRDRLRIMSQPLLDYVLNDAVDHFQHLRLLQFESILHDIRILAHNIQQQSRMWNNLCRSARRIVDPTTPNWPPSKHDLMLYTVVAYAPNSLLQIILRSAAFKPKESTNPLIYAAYFNKEERARTLLSRRVRLNGRGWDIDGFLQVFPIEVALQKRHYDMVTLFVREGSPIPLHVFTNARKIPPSIVRMLFQSDDFAEATNNRFDGAVDPPTGLVVCLSESEGTCEHELIAVLRRFIQVIESDLAYNEQAKKLLNFTVEEGHVSATRYLLSRGASIPPDILLTGMCRLWDNPRTTEMIHFLVENGANVHARAPTGDGVLHTALQALQNDDHALDTVNVLVSHGCDPLAGTPFGETPLHLAVDRGFVTVTRYLLSLGLPSSPDLLRAALKSCWPNKASMIDLLIEYGVDVHTHTAAGVPMLHSALQALWDEDTVLNIVKSLVSHGQDPLEMNTYGKSPLHIAVDRGFAPVIRYLLSLGLLPSPDLLHAALKSCWPNKASMIDLLIEYGVDVHTHTAAGVPVLHSALRAHSNENTVLKIVKLLVSRGQDPLETNTSGETPLHLAVNCGFVSVTRYLLSLGLPPSPNLLHVAFMSLAPNKATMVDCLLEYGVDVHTHTAAGVPVLHSTLQALWDEDTVLKIVKLLVSRGQDPLETNTSGKTPLHIAVDRGFLSVTQYLLSLSLPPSPDLLRVALKWYRPNKASMIDLLIEYGVDVHTHRDTAARDPLLHSALKAPLDEDTVLKIVKLLVSRGHDPLETNTSGETPLHIAVDSGFVSVTRYLLSLGISPSPDLLHVAFKSHTPNEASMIDLLIEHGVDVKTPTAAGDPVLHSVLQSLRDVDEGATLTIVKLLVGRGCDPLETNASAETPLHIAVRRGFVSAARYLISLGASPSSGHLDAALKNNRTSMIIYLLENGVHDIASHTADQVAEPILHTALGEFPDEHYTLKVVKILISHGCDPLIANSSGETPVHVAVKRGFVSVTRHLLSLNISPPPDLLHIALEECELQTENLNIILCLLENGADIQALTATGDPVLHTALRSSQDEDVTLEITKVLICHGCDPLGASLSGKTLVHLALERGFLSVARYFLSLGVPPSADLILVLFKLRFEHEDDERLQMLRCLLVNGADVHACTTAGDTLLGIALQSFLEEEPALEALKLLVHHGCNPFECDSHGKTPLSIAVEQGQVSLTGFLLSLGPSSILVSNLLWAALCSYQFRPKSQMINFLIDQGASVFVQAQNGDTLLHLAITSLDNDEVLPLVELLLTQGCNPMIPNDSGTTPLHVAVERGRISVVEFFLSQNIQPPPDILFTAIQSSPALSSDVRLKIVEVLVTFGCNTQTCNAIGQTPLQAAYLGGHMDVGDFLLLNLEYPPVQAGRTELASESTWGASESLTGELVLLRCYDYFDQPYEHQVTLSWAPRRVSLE